MTRQDRINIIYPSIKTHIRQWPVCRGAPFPLPWLRQWRLKMVAAVPTSLSHTAQAASISRSLRAQRCPGGSPEIRSKELQQPIKDRAALLPSLLATMASTMTTLIASNPLKFEGSPCPECLTTTQATPIKDQLLVSKIHPPQASQSSTTPITSQSSLTKFANREASATFLGAP